MMQPLWILAAGRYFLHLKNPFARGGGFADSSNLLFLCAGLLVALSALVALRFVRGRNRSDVNSPQRLFRELCAAHELGSADRQLLYKLAQHHGLKHPATLFVDSRLWDQQALGQPGRDKSQALQALRARLFAQR